MKVAIILLTCALLAAFHARAEAPVYSIDPVHTRVVFFVGHAGYARSIATASGATGELVFDPADWQASSVSVSLPVARIDFGDEDWNRRMGGRGFFRSARHPHITFVSTRVEPLDEDEALIHGELSVAGQRREVTLRATFNALERNPMTFRRTVGFSATTTLDRRDFGMDSYPNVIGNEVEVIIEVEAILGRAAVDAEPPEPADEPIEEER